MRCGIATVLSKIFTSGAIDASVGPSVLETINSLYTHLRTSVEQSSHNIEPDPDTQRFLLMEKFPRWHILTVCHFQVS